MSANITTETIKFDLSKKGGKFKLLNAINGGPWHKRHAKDQMCDNITDYKAARIPYSRNHDSAACPIYGGPHSHDITCIFPNFDADPYSPDSYDFVCTDESILACLDADTKTYFRLGQTIEHQIKKYGTIPPKDFHKWAVICEHIIRHYTEGWADGYHLDMEYWEIWNEPDLDKDDSPHKRCWGGTKAQFFDFYEIAAKYLKSTFPHLKIGGPALNSETPSWIEDFLREMHERNVPIDFFSWHFYDLDLSIMLERAQRIKNLLVKYGYENAESHLNEWNCITGWTDQEIFLDCMINLQGIKGAAFIMAVISASQAAPIDMLMYYDGRPTTMNGIFDLYARPLKGYYTFLWYSMFYDMEAEIKAENTVDNIYTLCGVDKDGKVLSVVTHYDYYGEENKQIKLDFGKAGKYEIYLIDENHTNELVATTDDLTFDMAPNSCILIKEI